ncbi:hypothetical protein [Spirosoma spitsbergense]|jgi:hypothetical protein|uniref:hypothetical protein n=1 Tax=Spirosoma spitsbergense TaxID=431554 RepID=UPI0003663433|nr:hypothetical protein [Spirosoma spitsbergense]
MHKKLVLLLLLGFLGLSIANAQIRVGNVNVDSLDIHYIELIGQNRSNYEASIWVDFGRGYELNRAGEFLKPINDHERVRFKSVVDALNYFYKNGWEVIQAYATGDYQHYVLQRRSRISK